MFLLMMEEQLPDPQKAATNRILNRNNVLRAQVPKKANNRTGISKRVPSFSEVCRQGTHLPSIGQ